jgi:hypothetical protein
MDVGGHELRVGLCGVPNLTMVKGEGKLTRLG